MNAESFRKLRAQTFLDAIGMELDQKWFEFLNSWEIIATEQLKLLKDEDWEEFFETINLSKMKRRMFEKGLETLKATDYDPFYVPSSIPITDPKKSISSSQQSKAYASKKQPASKNHIPHSKGGNLVSVEKFFSPLSEKKTRGVHVNLLAIEASDAPVLAAPVDWRNSRTEYDQWEDLKRIHDPAPEYERKLWNKDHIYEFEVEKIPHPGPVSNNFEDYLDYYFNLGPNLSRISSDTDIALGFKKKKKEIHESIKKAHPDRNNGQDKGTEKLKMQLDKIKEINGKFCAKSEAGYSGRLLYDIQCDQLKSNWRVHKKYDRHEVEQQFQQNMVSEKRKETIQKKEEMTNLEKCVYLFRPNGSQETEFKVSVYHAMSKDNIQNASIIRAICRKHAPTGSWDGRSTSQFYQKVKSIVSRAKKRICSESFDLKKLDSLSYMERQKVLKRKKSTTGEVRGQKKRPITKQQEDMEEALFAYIANLWKEKKRVTRTIIFKKALELYLLFKGGRKTNPKWMHQAKGWFYYGFKKRYNLSYTRVAGASRKLPSNWKELLESINRRVAKSQTPRKEGHLVIPAVPDGRVCNSDHIPFYRDMAGAYSWTQKGAGGGDKKELRGQLATGGGEKDRFTVQISCCKDGTKLPPFIIFKAKAPDGRREFNSNTVSYELKNRIPDNEGNSYPPPDKVYLTCNDTANSNFNFTKEILENIIFKELGVFDGNRATILVDDFKGHSHSDVKDYVTSFKSGTNNDHAEDRYNLVDFLIMAGGITPKGQPIDMIIGKILKGYFRDFYDDHMLICPVNSRGHPITPSRQLCATWVVDAWEQVSPKIIQKAWQLANYKSLEDIERENCSSEIVIFDRDHIVNEITLIDEQAVGHYLAEDNVLDDELEEDR